MKSLDEDNKQMHNAFRQMKEKLDEMSEASTLCL